MIGIPHSYTYLSTVFEGCLIRGLLVERCNATVVIGAA
jgi:hypothetical protein